MDIKVGDRVLTPEGTGFVLPTGVVSLDVPAGAEEKLVGVETVTQVFTDTLMKSGARLAPRLEKLLAEPGIERLAYPGRPTKVSYLRIIK